MKRALSVCIAAYNRKSVTLRCLRSLFQCELPDDVGLRVYLLDDESPDGTATAVMDEFPQVQLLRGNGSLYWAGGMRVAFGAALAAGSEWYLWLNDDVVLEPDAITRALATWADLQTHTSASAIVVGATRAPDGNSLTYGGQKSTSKLFPWKFRHVLPDAGGDPLPVDVVNGNFVLIPNDAARTLGNIRAAYVHAIGDFDYGLRANKAGIGCWAMPGFIGVCSNHPGASWRKPGLSFRERLQKLEHPLGFPWRPRLAYLTAHFPLWSPLLFVKPYLDIVWLSLCERLPGGRTSDA